MFNAGARQGVEHVRVPKNDNILAGKVGRELHDE